jgi:hypothetical protein
MRASIQSVWEQQQGLMGHGSAGDGMISAHETCISPADFRLAAGFGDRLIGREVVGIVVGCEGLRFE